jgi:hypothetical protein
MYFQLYTLSNKNLSSWNFVRPIPRVMWHMVAIVIWVVCTFPIFVHLWHFSLFHTIRSFRLHIYINQRHQYIFLNFKLKTKEQSLIYQGTWQASSAAKDGCCVQHRFLLYSVIAKSLKPLRQDTSTLQRPTMLVQVPVSAYFYYYYYFSWTGCTNGYYKRCTNPGCLGDYVWWCLPFST